MTDKDERTLVWTSNRSNLGVFKIYQLHDSGNLVFEYDLNSIGGGVETEIIGETELQLKEVKDLSEVLNHHLYGHFGN